MLPVSKHKLASVACALAMSACGGGDRVQVVEVEPTPTEHMVIAGSGLPSDAQGRDGDFYLDTQSLQLFGPRTNGLWPLPPRLLTGPVGANGQDGQNGQDGTSVLNGNGAPLNAHGKDGDFYIDLATTTFYGPKAGGAWPATGVSLVGGAGTAGGGVFNMQWQIPDNIGNGAGTYYLNPLGIIVGVRYPVLLPQACSEARLQVSTFGTLAPGNSFSFQVLRTPGPDLVAAATTEVTGLNCILNDNVRSCNRTTAASFDDGDAVEVRVVGTQAINTTGGSWSVSFTCGSPLP